MGFVKDELAEQNQQVKGVIKDWRMTLESKEHYQLPLILNFIGIRSVLNCLKTIYSNE